MKEFMVLAVVKKCGQFDFIAHLPILRCAVIDLSFEQWCTISLAVLSDCASACSISTQCWPIARCWLSYDSKLRSWLNKIVSNST